MLPAFIQHNYYARLFWEKLDFKLEVVLCEL